MFIINKINCLITLNKKKNIISSNIIKELTKYNAGFFNKFMLFFFFFIFYKRIIIYYINFTLKTISFSFNKNYLLLFIPFYIKVIYCGCVNCTGRKQQNSPPRREQQPLLHSQRRLGLGQSSTSQSSSNLGSTSNPVYIFNKLLEEEDIEEFINNKRIVKIPLINYQTFEKQEILVLKNIYSYGAINVNFAKFPNNALEIFIYLTNIKNEDQNNLNLFNRIITMRGHKIIGKNDKKIQRMLLEGGNKTLEEYFLNMNDRRPSIMKNILYQMAITVEQFHTCYTFKY
ncbi:hypothetical protein Mgra_00002858 [Meloidogyne graminicola]|uniref:Uncharacterized protein n=1 Tax=Meloidogyne graminicola TaxID=189291 RepID=A0A8S9ZWF5_9BILA|nr:hypothetical protein Mgra_00002858 [Meloidogyne graminicola]